MEKFRFLEHTADMKFQAFGKSLEEAFENAALAMFNVMYDGRIKAKIKKTIKIKGKDIESLLYNFLEELLFLLDSENFVLSKVNKISIITNINKMSEHKLASRISKDDDKSKSKQKERYKLEAEILGDNAKNYKFNLDVKAITYNEMFVKKEKINGKDKYVCQVVVDV